VGRASCSRRGVSRWSRDCVAPFHRKCDHSLGRPLGLWVFFEMELSFIVESKTFVFSVLDGASTMRVGEKRKSFSGEIFISSSCSEWLASTLECLVDFPEDQVFIKSFREGSSLDCSKRVGMGGRKMVYSDP